MRSLPSLTTSGSRSRFGRQAVAALLLMAHALVFSHVALIRHQAVARFGSVAWASLDEAAPTLAASDAGAAALSAGDEAAPRGTHDEHCAALSFTKSAAQLATHLALGLAVLDAPNLVVAGASSSAHPVDLLRLAPKSSPPQHG